jgi:hypothetical protein
LAARRGPPSSSNSRRSARAALREAAGSGDLLICLHHPVQPRGRPQPWRPAACGRDHRSCATVEIQRATNSRGTVDILMCERGGAFARWDSTGDYAPAIVVKIFVKQIEKTRVLLLRQSLNRGCLPTFGTSGSPIWGSRAEQNTRPHAWSESSLGSGPTSGAPSRG